MKNLKSSVLALLCIITIQFVFDTVFSQVGDRTSPVNNDLSVTNIGQNTEQTPFIRPKEENPNRGMTDEYGEYWQNYVLGNLSDSTKYVYVNYSSDFDQTDNGSVECWVYPTVRSNGIIISKGSASTVNYAFLLAISYSGKLVFRIGTTIYLSTGATIPLNKWTHVAATWTGGPSFTVTFYVNGAQDGTPQTESATWNTGADPVNIGTCQFVPGQYFKGYIDEVRFWDRARTLEQIRDNRFAGIGDCDNANYNNSLTSSSHYAGLISSWTFNNSAAAFDEISSHDGYYTGGASNVLAPAGSPMPYNQALRLFRGYNDYVKTISNYLYFGNGGTIELWFRPENTFAPSQTLTSKGTTPSTTTQIFGVASGGSLYFGAGLNTAISDGAPLKLGIWQHVAVTWITVGANFEVKFYLNGTQNGTTKYIPSISDSEFSQFYIGNSQAYTQPSAEGFIDEVRFWPRVLNQNSLRKYMYVSCRELTDSLPNLAFNFDGNLKNFGADAMQNFGTFNNGGINNCRFSGYSNENTVIPEPQDYEAHPTVLNRTEGPVPFPNGYYWKHPFTTIPDNNSNGLTDTIKINSWTGTVTSVEVFLSARHTWVSDLEITLTAPNGQTRYLINNNFSRYHILTFFNDNMPNSVSSTTFFSPWSYGVKPLETFGNFGGSTIQGNWVLKVADVAALDTGVLNSWGLRLNNTLVTGVEQVKPVAEKFELFQNYPNPFNPVTEIRFAIPENSGVKLKVYDMLGREMKTLVNEYMKKGTYNIKFDGSGLASGTYFYKIEAGKYSAIKKMVLIK